MAPSAGPPVMVVSGACASTVMARRAGEPSRLPPASARTSKTYAPLASFGSLSGDTHCAQSLAFTTRHSNVAPCVVEPKL